MTEDQRKLLESYGERIHEIEEEVSKLPIDKQMEIFEACGAATYKNCSVMAWNAASILGQRIAHNITHGKVPD